MSNNMLWISRCRLKKLIKKKKNMHQSRFQFTSWTMLSWLWRESFFYSLCKCFRLAKHRTAGLIKGAHVRRSGTKHLGHCAFKNPPRKCFTGTIAFSFSAKVPAVVSVPSTICARQSQQVWVFRRSSILRRKTRYEFCPWNRGILILYKVVSR